ncbi:MAG: YfhO family protein [Candidatus Hydrogenedentes bacterium]|nr:YfhO family protein [Candidatus Hydrogenedentota bacterium]
MKADAERARPLSARELLVHALLLVALLACAFPGAFFKGRLVSSADMIFELHPWDRYRPEGYDGPQNRLLFDPLISFRPDNLLIQEAVRHGEWPLWNTLEYGGMPLLANHQTALFYPPRLIVPFLDVDLAMHLLVLFRLWLCGITAYVCTRLLRMSIPGARFFSVAWMLATFNLLWCYHPLPDVSCWLPVLFVGVEFVLEGRYRRGFSAMVFGAVLILFAGHPESCFAFCEGLGLYFLARLILERRWGRRLWAPVAVCAGAWTLALLVYAVQVIPFLEYLVNSYTYSVRSGEGHHAAFPAGALVTFWVPRFFGTTADGTFYDLSKWNSNIMCAQYPGMAVWCGIMLLLARRGKAGAAPTEGPGARVPALVITTVFFVLLSFDFPTLSWVHRLPLLSSMQEIYHVCFAHFALPMLGAIGLERWFSRPRRLRGLAWIAPLAVAVAILVTVLYRFNAGMLNMCGVAHYVQIQILIVALFAAAACVILAVSCFSSRPRLFYALLTVCVAADLLVNMRGMLPTMARDQIFPETKLTTFLEGVPRPARIGVAEGSVESGAISNYGIEEWLGYDGLFPERPIRFQKELGPDVWNAMEPVYSIQYYLHEPKYDPKFPLEELLEKGDMAYVDTLDGREIYKNRRAFPRAFLAAGIEVIPDADALFERMLSDDFDPRRTVAIQVAPKGELPHAAADGALAALGTADIAEYRPTHIRIDVDAAERAVLVLSDSYYPGWQARIDGEPAEVFPAYYAFRGVVVPAGQHTVEFSYFPWSLRIGLAISTLALIAGLVGGIGLMRRQ